MYLISGEALFDCFLDSEEAPDALRFDFRAGGSPFNVAIGIRRLGGRSALLTGISNDMLGQRLVRILERESVATDYLVRSERRTTLSLVGVDTEGQPAYLFYGSDSADSSLTRAELPTIGPEVTGLHFGSYSLVVQPVADALASLAASAGERFVSLDPNVRPTIEPDLDIWRMRVREYASLANLVKTSCEDIALLYPETDPENVAMDWLGLGVQLVVVTDGGGDIKAWSKDGCTVRVSPPSSAVADTVGAGDSFQAALLARLAAHGDPATAVASLDDARLAELVIYGARAAAITCSRRGADLPHGHEIGEA